jgi:hypothetical protein
MGGGAREPGGRANCPWRAAPKPRVPGPCRKLKRSPPGAGLARQALEVLTAEQRQAIELAFFSGLTYVEVVEIVSPNDKFEALFAKTLRYRRCGTKEVYIFSIESRQCVFPARHGSSEREPGFPSQASRSELQNCSQ